ncbi:TOPRIM nucleotidyl transferase/hydrolase domain-containing protein [Agromyces sp. NPDC060279]|uniref:TOPRIM nucleotidyl transferase/hydrolase domain-containing protein n=1 Tax=Agromyces sp. NPDC060279 TaxID=3347092 RepID=UPI003660B62C
MPVFEVTGRRAPRAAVLVEGDSDAVVVERLAASRGIRFDGGASGAELVPMQGVTNIRRIVARLRADQPRTVVLGLADAPEERFVASAIADGGAPPDRDGLAARGFFVCVRDLEDELIRALGTDAVEDALREIGDAGRFATFQRQPDWRDRARADQLHRFAGSGAGRKRALAARLAERLDASTTPVPIRGLLDRLELELG